MSSKVQEWLRDNLRVNSTTFLDSESSDCSESSNPKRKYFQNISLEEYDEDHESLSSNPKRRNDSILVVNEPLVDSDVSVGDYCITPDVDKSHGTSDYFSENSNKIQVKEVKFPCGNISGCRHKSKANSIRPCHTFHCLITYSIEEVGNGRLVSTSQIIDFLTNEFPYFAETPLNIWFPSVNNILKKKFDCYPEDHSEPSWAIRAPYNPERQSICSTISSVQSYETTESANKVILALDLDISEEEQVIETEVRNFFFIFYNVILTYILLKKINIVYSSALNPSRISWRKT